MFELDSSQTLVVSGLTLVAMLFILWRGVFCAPSKSLLQSDSRIVSSDLPSIPGSNRGDNQPSLNVCDLAREVDTRLRTKLATLDRLIVDADREIIRLEQVLAESKRTASPRARASRAPDAMIPQIRRDAA